MIADVISDARQRMSKTVDAAREDFGTVSAGRANPALFQKVLVDYYGSPTPLAQLAGLQNPEARVLLVTPYDKSALKEIEKAIVAMPSLSANVGNDGEIVRVTLPELTEDRRKEFVKIVRGKGEDAKVAIRNVRRKAKEELDRMAKDGEVGEDDVARAEKELQAVTDRYPGQVDDLVKNKEAELLEV